MIKFFSVKCNSPSIPSVSWSFGPSISFPAVCHVRIQSGLTLPCSSLIRWTAFRLLFAMDTYLGLQGSISTTLNDWRSRIFILETVEKQTNMNCNLIIKLWHVGVGLGPNQTLAMKQHAPKTRPSSRWSKLSPEKQLSLVIKILQVCLHPVCYDVLI